MLKYLKTSKIKNKTVLLRVDVNEPLDEKSGTVADDFRIRAIIPTIKHLLKDGNRVILLAHLGRPEGKWTGELSLKPVAERMAQLLDVKFSQTGYSLPDYPLGHLIFYTGDLNDERHIAQLQRVKEKDVVMIENLRFYPEEDANSAAFAKKLASLGDVYVNDAFSVCHRKAASVSAITKYLPSYCGLLLEKEVKSLNHVLERGRKPFVVMMGGIKISDKVKTLENLGKKADTLLVGGGIANLFFKSRGYEVGLSKVEDEGVRLAFQMDKGFKGKIVLPVDVVVADKDMDHGTIRVTAPHEVRKNEIILDCGPKTILLFANYLKPAQTIVWNGPLGFFEHKPFHTATMALARIVGGVSTRKAFGVVGGGETVDAVRQSHQLEHIDHVSTGGGAMLEYLAGQKLPGIEALK